MTSNIVCGAHAKVLINGRHFGRIYEISYDSHTPHAPLHTLDTSQPVELVPTTAILSGQMTIYRLHRDGGIEAAAMASDWDNLAREKYFSIAVIDRSAGGILFRATHCSTIGQNWRFNKGLTMGLIQFSGKDFRNS